MRDIKFRGMSVSGEWHIGLLANPTVSVNNMIKEGFYISNSKGMPFAYEVRPETVGQFTGLSDKNGKEIYEGDIVAHKNPDCKGEVCFGQYESGEYDTYVSGNGFYINRELAYCGRVHHEPLECGKGIEIIGSIHQHPHLLP